LRGVNFQEAFLQGALFVYSNLSDTKFIGSQLQGSSFKESLGEKVIFSYAQMQGSDFSHANFINSEFNYSSLIASLFYRADLTGSSFRFSNLSAVSFIEANLSGTDFRQANITAADLSQQVQGSGRLDHALPDYNLMLNEEKTKLIHKEKLKKSHSLIIQDLVCSGDDYAIYVIRNLIHKYSSFSIDKSAVEFILSSSCPVSKYMSEYEKEQMREMAVNTQD